MKIILALAVTASLAAARTPYPDCPRICTALYQPVCGYNKDAKPQYLTFSNDCTLTSSRQCGVTNYQKHKDGPCGSSDTKRVHVKA